MGLRSGEVVEQCAFDLYRDHPGVLESIRRSVTGETFTARIRVAEYH